MTEKLKDDNLKEVTGGDSSPAENANDAGGEVLYSFSSGEIIYSTMYSYYQVKQTGSFKFDEDVLCDAYAFFVNGGFKLSAADVTIKATVLNTYRNNKL